MSDFDKEAEREKLREKFARDEQKRERTSRMSELLLKGATMTNKHHDCGSPVFRWKGEEFCPTCQGAPVEGAAGAEQGGEADPSGDSEATADATPVELESPNADGTTTENGETDADVASRAEPEPTRTESTTLEPDATPNPAPDRQPAARRQPPATPDRTESTGGGGDLAAARDSLTRTLTSLTQRAEATDDVSKQRDLLAAAREAAEALEATKQAER